MRAKVVLVPSHEPEARSTFHKAESDPCWRRELLGLGLGLGLGLDLSPLPCCSAYDPCHISQSQGQASRKVSSLFYLAEHWESHWPGFNWPENQSPTERSLTSPAKLLVPCQSRPDKQPCLRCI